MARQFRWVLAAIFVAGAGTAGAHGRQAEPPQAPKQNQQQPQQNQPERDGRRDGSHDRRMWWKDPKDMAEIGLTAEQSATIDAIFKAELAKILPLRESVQELERTLNETIRANTTDTAIFARQVQKIEAKRAELNTMRTVMLYRMRRVLNADQNARFQAMVDRQNERRRQDSDRRR
jgi:Spy/CpxP family protein refolding chaperone